MACVIAVNAVVPAWSETIRQNGKDTASSDTDGYSTQDLSYTPETVPDYYDEDMTDTGILTSHKSKKIAEPVGAGAWDGTSVFQDGIIYIKSYSHFKSSNVFITSSIDLASITFIFSFFSFLYLRASL